MKKSTALETSRSGGAQNPHVFQYTLQLLVPSLGLAPTGLALRFAPGETVLRCDGMRLSFARDNFFTSSTRSAAKSKRGTSGLSGARILRGHRACHPR
ncbi:MAG: hypothetical protein ACREYE_33425 [Gammaproteobacteria bacterium]